MPRSCPTCQQLVDDDRLVACPRCHASLTTLPQVPTLSKEQEDRLVSAVIDSLSKSGPMLDKLVQPVSLRIIKSVHWWIAFPLFWIAVVVGSHFTIKGALESLMINRIDQEFREPRIQETMQKVVNDKASQMLTNEIQPEVTRFYDETTEQVQNFQGFLDNLKADFQREYQTLAEEVARLTQRNHLMVLGDRAISEGDREALNELIGISNNSNENSIKIEADAELSKIISFWLLMSRTQTESIKVTLPDGTVKIDHDIPTYQLIIELLWNSKWQVRAVAARLLGTRREKGIPDSLLQVIRNDKHLEVVKYAIVSFRDMTDVKGIGFFNFDGLERWWQEHSAEVNERLTDMK